MALLYGETVFFDIIRIDNSKNQQILHPTQNLFITSNDTPYQ